MLGKWVDSLVFNFDIFDRFEIPIVTLCNPDKRELGQISQPIDFNVDIRFNAVSEISFKYPKKIQNDIISPLYEEILPRRLLLLENMGYYVITDNPTEYNDGVNFYKEVTAVSYEFTLNNKKLNVFSGTYKFYDPINTADSLLGRIVSQLVHWNIGYVSADLWSKFRTFDVSDSTIYNFLMNDVEQSYECIFEFDSYNNTINAYSLSEVVKKTDIYVDYDNLIKDLSIETIDENLVTSLSCFGSNNLNISTANPLGGTLIYNFSYFKHMMSKSLSDAIDIWEDLIVNNRELYRNIILDYRNALEEYTLASGVLTGLQGEYTAIETVQSVQIQQGIDKTDRVAYQDTLDKLSAKQSEINQQQTVVDNFLSQQNLLKAQLDGINELLDKNNNFTDEQLKELEYYIIESTYQDDSFTQTSEMTDAEVQDVAIQLYDQSVSLLNRVSNPSYTITVNTINFLLNSIFKDFARNFEVGKSINLAIYDDTYIEAVALRVSFQFDDPESFQLEIANRYRLNSEEWRFSDLYQSSTSASTSVSFNGSGWNDWVDKESEVLGFINNSLELTRNELVNNSNNVTMTMNQNGLRGKELLDDGSYSGNQIWITNNVLAFSDDGFQTVKTAIGKIQLTDTTYSYGLNAETLIGKTIIGNQLTIGNENNTILLDGNGLTITTNDNKSQILLNPEDGIRVQTRPTGGTFSDKLYISTDGNMVLEGRIEASSGLIGGFEIYDNSIESSNGNIRLESDGTGRIGLLTFSTNTATFNGDIYARNLQDQVETDKIATDAVTNDKISNNAVDTGQIVSGAVTPAKLDRLYATEASFNSLSADVATIERLYVTSADVETLIAEEIDVKLQNAYSIDSYFLGGTECFFYDMEVTNDARLLGDFYFNGKIITTKSVAFTNGAGEFITLKYLGWS